MTAQDMLSNVRQVLEERAETHGEAALFFERIAKVWSARLAVEITPAQVAIMMIDFKGARAWDKPGHPDNWADMAGYAALGGEIAGRE